MLFLRPSAGEPESPALLHCYRAVVSVHIPGVPETSHGKAQTTQLQFICCANLAGASSKRETAMAWTHSSCTKRARDLLPGPAANERLPCRRERYTWPMTHLLLLVFFHLPVGSGVCAPWIPLETIKPIPTRDTVAEKQAAMPGPINPMCGVSVTKASR